MSMDLLRQLAAMALPAVALDPATIEGLRGLEAAGHVRVLIPPAHVDCDDCLRQDAATVFEITPRGWARLADDLAPESPGAAAARPLALDRAPRPQGPVEPGAVGPKWHIARRPSDVIAITVAPVQMRPEMSNRRRT